MKAIAATMKTIKVKTPALKEDVEMEEAEPQGPVIDDDGFELVQKKGRRR